MHLPVDELLSLARGEEDSAASHAHLAACPACSAELSRLRALRAGLAALPAIAPPEDGWTRVVAAAAAPPVRAARWPAALAASLAIFSIAFFAALRVDGGATVAPPSAAAIGTAAAGRDAGWEIVQAENARLEALLAALPEDQHVRASTGTTVSALEDRLAIVDDQLSAAAFEPLAPGEAEGLWRTRLDLMNSLVQVRYGQVTAGL